MKRLYYLSFLLLTAVSCNRNSAIIDAKINGLNGGEIVISELNVSQQQVLDTVKTDEAGMFKYRLKKISETPEFYYLYYHNTKIASLILKAGDKVHLIADTLGETYKVDGSEESRILSQLESDFRTYLFRFDSLSAMFRGAKENNENLKADSLNYKLGSVYVKYRQSAVESIFKNPNSLTNIYLLYQMFPGNIPVFGDVKDALIFTRVHDSLKVTYPHSRYLSLLEKESNNRSRAEAFNSKLESSSVTVLPEISLPDTKAKIKNLTDLKGKVILLSFWTITDPEQKMFNKELLSIYDKYKARGFEIYQVSVDIDKTTWARAVSDQNLPWISVCDGMGVNCKAVGSYNVQQVPAMYLIDKNGDIVARNIFNVQALDSKIASLL